MTGACSGPESMDAIFQAVTALAAAATAVTALAGLRTWKKQAHFQINHDAAYRILTSAYKLRNALQLVRNPIITGGEISGATGESREGQEKRRVSTQEDLVAVYEKRWGAVSNALSELDAGLLEGEVLWGSDIRELAKPLKMCAIELYTAIQIHFDAFNQGDRRWKTPEDLRDNDEVVFSMGEGPDKDKFYAKVLEAITPIEKKLRPYLKK
jgi:hypothetical protein